MTKDTLLNEVTQDRRHVKRTFEEVREALEKAKSKEDLTELYKQCVYMILLTHSSPVEEKYDKDMRSRRETTEKEFARTVQMINNQAKKLGVEANYNEDWEKLATNGYQAEGEETLEAQSNVGIIRE